MSLVRPYFYHARIAFPHTPLLPAVREMRLVKENKSPDRSIRHLMFDSLHQVTGKWDRCTYDLQEGSRGQGKWPVAGRLGLFPVIREDVMGLLVTLPVNEGECGW